ncbi:winged helix-turn-helix domain-containing protein [Pseudomonas sp. P39-UII1]
MTLPNKILRVLQDNQSLGSRDIAERVNASWSTVVR